MAHTGGLPGDQEGGALSLKFSAPTPLRAALGCPPFRV
jgi:hypothetical protein